MKKSILRDGIIATLIVVIIILLLAAFVTFLAKTSKINDYIYYPSTNEYSLEFTTFTGRDRDMTVSQTTFERAVANQ